MTRKQEKLANVLSFIAIIIIGMVLINEFITVLAN